MLNKKGFTLIEVLVVVLIIGILAALAAPNILGRIEQARITNDKALAKTIENAVASYLVDTDAAGTPSTPPGYAADTPTGYKGFKDAIVNNVYLDQGTVDYITDTANTNYEEGSNYFAIKGKAKNWVIVYQLTTKDDGSGTQVPDGGFVVSAYDITDSTLTATDPKPTFTPPAGT